MLALREVKAGGAEVEGRHRLYSKFGVVAYMSKLHQTLSLKFK